MNHLSNIDSFPSDEARRPQIMMVTDFRIPEGDPARYTAIMVTADQLKEMEQFSSEEAYVRYSHWEGKTLYSNPVPVKVAKPLFLATKSSLRASGETQQQATMKMIEHYTHLGNAAARGLRLQ